MVAVISLADATTAWVSGLVGDVRSPAIWVWVRPPMTDGVKLEPESTQRFDTSTSGKSFLPSRTG